MTTAVQIRMEPVATPRFYWLRWLAGLLIGIVILIAMIGVGLYTTAANNLTDLAAAPILAETTQFDGRYLIAASDADMVGTAYADGILRQIPGDVDTLSLVELPLQDTSARVYEIPVSSAVTSWPQITAVSPDGNQIYVVETSAPVDDAIAQLSTSEMTPGRLLTVVDISAGAEAATSRTVEVGTGAIHLGLSADGAYLAVGLEESGRQLAILPTATLDNPATFRYFPVNLSSGEAADEVTSVFWHPSGEFLAVGISAEEIQFYRFSHTENGEISLTPHGERITVGNTFGYGQFTKDGRFYLTTEINWERYPAPLGNLINPPGEMLSIQFDASEQAEHQIVSRVTVGQSPEGFAISTAEDLIVTVNMRRTYLPDNLTFWPGTDLNSLSLLTFDRETGELAHVDEYGFEGVLPEDAMFDVDGSSLGVVIYNERENPMQPGYIEFWNVIWQDSTPRLERTTVRLPVVRGPHAMNLIP